MRQAFRVLAILLISLLSLDIFVWLVDWAARWEWLENLMTAHPLIDKFVHTPLAYLVLLVGGFVFLRAEKWLKQPRILAKYLNARVFPNLHKTKMQSVFNEGKPGAELEKLNWEWFAEVQLANDSDTPTTIEEVKVKVRVGHKWWWKRTVKTEHIQDMRAYKKDMGFDDSGNSISHTSGTKYAPVYSLLELIRGEALTKGIGHRGWLRFDVEQVSRKEINTNRVHMDIWLVDALDGKHKVSFKSDRDWDKNFLIFEDDN